MNRSILLIATFLLLVVRTTLGQGPSFTYQGKLDQSGLAAGGLYDLQFSLHDSVSGGVQVAGPLALAPVGVTNGLFSVSLNFGAGAFTGNPRWLQIGVRTNGTAAAYSVLAPRQPITAAPYAVLAGGVSGAIADTQLSANIPRLNANQVFAGSVNFANPAGIGIGGSVPQSWLHVGGTTENLGLFTTANSAGARLHLENTGPGGRRWSLISTGTGSSDGAGQLQFLGNGATRLTLRDNGHVGIGTGVPGNLLEVFGPGTTNGGNAGFPEVVARFRRNAGGHSALTVDAPAGQDAILYFAEAGAPLWGLRADADNLKNLQLRYQRDGANQTALSVSTNLTVGVGRLVVDQFGQSGNGITGIQLGGASSGEIIASKRTAGGNVFGIDFWTANTRRMSIANNGNVGIGLDTPGGKLDVSTGNGVLRITGDLVPAIHAVGGTIPGTARFRDTLEIFPSLDGARVGKLDVRDTNGAPTITLSGTGVATVKVLEITGGADIAEPFRMSHPEELPAGAVVVIDADNPGQLKLSEQAYDTRVAGIISGANGVNPGLALHQQGRFEGGQNVALTGRVYALADAAHGAIKPGDLLTTSDTPGHAMKVADRARGPGAILGKAMTELKEGQGLVLVLVSLQ